MTPGIRWVLTVWAVISSLTGNIALLSAETVAATLVRIVDGDTIEVRILSPGEVEPETRMVRLLGIDAPETRQPGGAEATLFIREWIGNVPDLTIEIESTDRYGRLVGEVFQIDRSNHPSLNAALIATGHAWWYRDYAPGREDFAHLERTARDTHRGIWKTDDPVEPWVWRRRM